MYKGEFVHLHNHSTFSLLDGLATPEEYVAVAAENEQHAVALTDHGGLSGIFKFYKASKDAGIKPIIGCEFYYAPNGRHHKEAVRLGSEDQRKSDVSGSGAYTHLTVLATNDVGLRNLYRLQSAAYAEGFYFKPRIDLELLRLHNAGLIVLSGCPGSLVSTYVRLGQFENARAHLEELKDIFDDRLYVEVMAHGIETEELSERKLNSALIELARVSGVPLVATNDAHYARPSDHRVHAALLCVQTRSTLEAPKFSFAGSGYHLASSEEMARLLDAAGLPESSAAATLEIAERIESYDAVFKHQLRMPNFKVPEDWDAEAAMIEVMDYECDVNG